MQYLPSFNQLSTDHKSFVTAYLRLGNDAFRACCFLHPDDSNETNSGRAHRLMKREDIAQAIADKLEQQQAKSTITREDITKEIKDLIEEAKNLDPSRVTFALNFRLKALEAMSKLQGLHQTRHIHDHNHRSIVVNINDVDHEGNVIETKAESVDCARLEEGDPGQLAISFPSVHAVPYTLEELLSDDLPDDMGNPDEMSGEDPI